MAVDIKLEGKEISKALVDMFSPATNFLGTLGDKVRVYRQLSLMKSIKRANEIAASEGLQLAEPPLKFLVPFMEECSLESPDDSKMIEMWARLLASSSSNYESDCHLFIRILREITPDEARLIDYMCSPKSADLNSHLSDVGFDWHDSFVYARLQRIIESLEEPLNKNTDFSFIMSEFYKESEERGTLIYFFLICKGEEGKTYLSEEILTSGRGPIDDDYKRSSIAILKSLGLLGDYRSPEFWFGNYVFEVNAYYITELGYHFIEACTDIDVAGYSRS